MLTKIKIQEQEARTTILRNRARERQGLSSLEEPPPKQISSHTETRYEIVIRNGACVSVPITEEKNLVQFTPSGHVNFFANLEEGKQIEGVGNKEHELEKKKEQEDYEKQIGLLTYLGQGSKESGESAWYEKPSLLRSLKDQPVEEINQKAQRAKDMFDPLRVIRHYIGKPEPIKKTVAVKQTNSDLRFPAAPLINPESIKSSEHERKAKKKKRKSGEKHKKSKKHKKAKSKRRRTSHDSDSEKKKNRDSSASEDSSEDSDSEKRKRLAILREKRLQREKAERAKANKLLAIVNGSTAAPSITRNDKSENEDSEDSDEKPARKRSKQKYHSQYNPDLAKQNQPLDSSTKYWLQ